MNELIKKCFQWLECYWHKKPTGFIAPAAASVASLLLLSSGHLGTISTTDAVMCFVTGGVVAVIWVLTNRLPKVTTGNAGIVIGILCDDPAEDKQVKADFVTNLRQLIQQGGGRFQLVELPNWSLDGFDEPNTVAKLLKRTRGHFLLYGRVRVRNVNGKMAHLLNFEGVVRHRPVPDQVSEELRADFLNVLPRKVVIEKENDAFSFEITSEWIDVSTRYVVGSAALISGDVAYAEKLFLGVEIKLKRHRASFAGIQEIARRLPQRFEQLYNAWLQALHQVYFSTRDRRYLMKTDEISSRLLARCPNNQPAMIFKAICEFVLRRNVPAAHKLITRCRNNSDSTWWYSRAFLHAYQGKMDEAASDYRHAFAGPIRDVTVPVQSEEFIAIVLAEEPDRVQLHFCLGLINFYAKADYMAAERDFKQFLTMVKNDDFPREVAAAQQLISECSSQGSSGANSGVTG